ncbi:Uncharacterized protein TCM_003864 [Theobroma cacao]|uniref:Uncharacterized protein n=1 Tax=Theobroma cacao TaxID=3641 RepID=A0A061DNA9_THECC|nr:Uncharacterized protein TCM_003864 [Theobroma cacao]
MNDEFKIFFIFFNHGLLGNLWRVLERSLKTYYRSFKSHLWCCHDPNPGVRDRCMSLASRDRKTLASLKIFRQKSYIIS